MGGGGLNGRGENFFVWEIKRPRGKESEGPKGPGAEKGLKSKDRSSPRGPSPGQELFKLPK